MLEKIAAKFNLKKNKQLQLPQWLHTLQEMAVFSKDIEAMWFGLFGFKNSLPINLLKCCHKSPATHPGKILYVNLLITCMPSSDLKTTFLNVCKISYVYEDNCGFFTSLSYLYI